REQPVRSPRGKTPALRHRARRWRTIVLWLAAIALSSCGGKNVQCSNDSDCPTGHPCGGAGDCVPPPPKPCAGGQTPCGTQCFDIAADTRNCGSCGHVCTAGLACSNGTCQAACAIGLTQCDSRCVDAMKDAANCGGCGTACAPG